MNNVLKLFRANKKVNHKFILSYIAGLINILLLLIPAQILMVIIDAIKAFDKKSLIHAGYMAIGGITLLTLSIYINRVLFARALNASEKNIQGQLLSKMFALKKRRFQMYSTGQIITIILQNVEEAIRVGITGMFNMITGSVGLIIILGYMYFLSFELMVSLAAFNIIILVITLVMGKKLKEVRGEIIEMNNKGNHLLLDLLNNSIIIRVFNKDAFFYNTYEANEKKIYKSNIKAFILQHGTSEFVWCTKKIAEIALLYGLGGWLVYNGKTDIGIIAAYTLISDVFTKNINLIKLGVMDLNKAIPHIDAVVALLEEKETEKEIKQQLNNCKGVIQFENVSFSYNGKKILNNISFSINDGDKVMLTGGNGQGKTTLLNLISGVYRPETGNIYIDDQIINEIHIDAISDTYCHISQMPQIVPGTAYNNISLSENYDEKYCQELIKKLNIRSSIGEPELFSEGEKQRLSIGRGLYHCKDKPIIMGDEIFAFIDKENKKRISTLLNSIFKNKTLIMVCHSSSHINFNKQLIINDGKVEMLGIEGFEEYVY